MHHAQVLLCVSGALMMVLINDSLARAFGIAGAASLVRFRTPVDDPRDAAVMFLLMGLGMASGLGAFAIAVSGTVMVCLFLVVLARLSTAQTRSLRVELVAEGGRFPERARAAGMRAARRIARGARGVVRRRGPRQLRGDGAGGTLARRAQRRADGRRRGRSARHHVGTGPQAAAVMAAPRERLVIEPAGRRRAVLRCHPRRAPAPRAVDFPVRRRARAAGAGRRVRPRRGRLRHRDGARQGRGARSRSGLRLADRARHRGPPGRRALRSITRSTWSPTSAWRWSRRSTTPRSASRAPATSCSSRAIRAVVSGLTRPLRRRLGGPAGIAHRARNASG